MCSYVSSYVYLIWFDLIWFDLILIWFMIWFMIDQIISRCWWSWKCHRPIPAWVPMVSFLGGSLSRPPMLLTSSCDLIFWFSISADNEKQKKMQKTNKREKKTKASNWFTRFTYPPPPFSSSSSPSPTSIFLLQTSPLLHDFTIKWIWFFKNNFLFGLFFLSLSLSPITYLSLSFFLYLYFFLYLFQHESHSIDPLTLAFIYVHSFSSIHPFIHSSTPSLSLNILENCVKLLFICSPWRLKLKTNETSSKKKKNKDRESIHPSTLIPWHECLDGFPW